MGFEIDVFETPVTVTLQQEISKKNFKFFENSLKILNVYFWGKNIDFWERAFTFGEITFTFGDNRGFSGFLEFLFLLLGAFGTPWVGGPRRGFRKYLSFEGKPHILDPVKRPHWKRNSSLGNQKERNERPLTLQEGLKWGRSRYTDSKQLGCSRTQSLESPGYYVCFRTFLGVSRLSSVTSLLGDREGWGANLRELGGVKFWISRVPWNWPLCTEIR